VREDFYQDHNIQDNRNFKGYNNYLRVILFVFIANLLCNPSRFLCATFYSDIVYSSEEEEFTYRFFILCGLPCQAPDPDQLALRQQPCSKSQEEMGEEAETETETETVEETGRTATCTGRSSSSERLRFHSGTSCTDSVH
jgi:hypothetical protein